MSFIISLSVIFVNLARPKYSVEYIGLSGPRAISVFALIAQEVDLIFYRLYLNVNRKKDSSFSPIYEIIIKLNNVVLSRHENDFEQYCSNLIAISVRKISSDRNNLSVPPVSLFWHTVKCTSRSSPFEREALTGNIVKTT